MRVALIAMSAWSSAAIAQQTAALPQGQVSVALVLAADVSSSINQERFRLQREGYAAAMTNPNVLRAIRDSEHGRIAVTYFEWAGSGSQQVIIPWTIISNADEAEAIAERLINTPRPFGGSTSISGAIDYAVYLLEASPYRDVRRVIDVSGDGVNNEGRSTQAARDDALARNIAINGLVIMADQQAQQQSRNAWRPANEPPLDEFYRDNVVGGMGAFVIAINDFDVFGYAIVNKMVREVAGVAPATRFAELDRRDIRIGSPGEDFVPTVSTSTAALPTGW
jgi:hypothetical protein